MGAKRINLCTEVWLKGLGRTIYNLVRQKIETDPAHPQITFSDIRLEYQVEQMSFAQVTSEAEIIFLSYYSRARHFSSFRGNKKRVPKKSCLIQTIISYSGDARLLKIRVIYFLVNLSGHNFLIFQDSLTAIWRSELARIMPWRRCDTFMYILKGA